MLKEILRRGYFPKELPTPFNTESYAKALGGGMKGLPTPLSYGAQGPKYGSRAFPFNVARRGKIRRPLSVPNPINFFHLASLISENWSVLEAHYAKANQSLSKPVFSLKGRAFEWEKGFELLARSKLETRNASKYIVKTDISNFYPSVYTHSIPWALHTKAVGKKNRKFEENLGNKLDVVIRNGQEGQTKGVPIGPDTSLVIAEVILTSIDEALIKNIGTKYYRYLDDFEFGCSTAQEADNVLGTLQEILGDYELALNPSKTIVKDLPSAVDPLWIHELASFDFRSAEKGQEKDLLHYFDLSIDRFSKYPDDPVIKYAIKRTSSLDIKAANWPLYENLVLQWAAAEPGVLQISIDFLKHYANCGRTIDPDKVKDTLQHIITIHAAMGHTSELTWSIWGMILFGLPLDGDVVGILESIENPVVALLCLDAQNQKLIDPGHEFKLWASLMSESELKGANWLLAYEGLLKGWLPSADGTDYLSSAEGFSQLRNKNVSFYNAARTFSYKPHIKYWFLTRPSLEYEIYGGHAADTSLEPPL